MTEHGTTPGPGGLLALFLPAEGGITTMTLPSDPDQRADAIAHRVDGMIAVVALDEHAHMWVNDEFLFRWPDQPNVMATRVPGAHGYDFQAQDRGGLRPGSIPTTLAPPTTPRPARTGRAGAPSPGPPGSRTARPPPAGATTTPPGPRCSRPSADLVGSPAGGPGVGTPGTASRSSGLHGGDPWPVPTVSQGIRLPTRRLFPRRRSVHLTGRAGVHRLVDELGLQWWARGRGRGWRPRPDQGDYLTMADEDREREIEQGLSRCFEVMRGAARESSSTVFRETGAVPPPRALLFMDDWVPPYIGQVSTRPFYRGPDAAAAIRRLGLLPAAFAATHVMVIYEHADLELALGDGQDVRLGLIEVTASLTGPDQVTVHPYRERSRHQLPSGMLGMDVEWDEPVPLGDTALPGPVAELLTDWRENFARVGEIRDVAEQLSSEGFTLHFPGRHEGPQQPNSIGGPSQPDHTIQDTEHEPTPPPAQRRWWPRRRATRD